MGAERAPRDNESGDGVVGALRSQDAEEGQVATRKKRH